jgi:hypothetical protein
LLLAAVALAIVLTIWDLRRIVLAEATANSENLAIVLAEQTKHSVQAVDIVLRDVQDRIKALGLTTPEEFLRVLATHETYDYLRPAGSVAAGGYPRGDRRRWGPS